MKWFRFYPSFIDDFRLSKIPDWQQLLLIKLMCAEANGYLSPSYTSGFEEDLAAALRVSDSQWIQARDLFMEKGFLKRKGNGFSVTYFEDFAPCELRLPLSQWRVLRESIFLRDNYTCQYCGAYGVSLQCDHVIPISRGGSNDESNLVTACKPCNLSKHNKTPEEWKGVKNEVV
jgi:HNH endonuclease